MMMMRTNPTSLTQPLALHCGPVSCVHDIRCGTLAPSLWARPPVSCNSNAVVPPTAMAFAAARGGAPSGVGGWSAGAFDR